MPNDFSSPISECTVSCQCSVLVSWTEQSSSFLKHGELEAFAKDFCHHVWTVQVKNKVNLTLNYFYMIKHITYLFIWKKLLQNPLRELLNCDDSMMHFGLLPTFILKES